MIRAFVLSFCVVWMSTGDVRAADVFLSVIDDLPVMAEMTELKDAAVAFETPNGRIAEATIQGPVSADKVAAFNSSVLPQFGWIRQGDGSYLREGERLRIEYAAASGGQTQVRYSLTPARP